MEKKEKEKNTRSSKRLRFPVTFQPVFTSDFSLSRDYRRILYHPHHQFFIQPPQHEHKPTLIHDIIMIPSSIFP